MTVSEGDVTAPPAEDTFPGFPAVEQTRAEPSAADAPVMIMHPVDNAHVPHSGGDASHVLTPGDAAIAAPPRPWKEVGLFVPRKVEKSHSFCSSAHEILVFLELCLCVQKQVIMHTVWMGIGCQNFSPHPFMFWPSPRSTLEKLAIAAFKNQHPFCICHPGE